MPWLSDPRLCNGLWFQLFWITTIGLQSPWPGVVLIALHLGLYKMDTKVLGGVLLCAGIGIMTDTLLSLLGIYQFDKGALLPAWLVLLWLGFALSLPLSLSLFFSPLWLAILVGTLGGGLSYLAAARLQAVTFPGGALYTTALIGAIWAVLFPLFAWITTVSDHKRVAP